MHQTSLSRSIGANANTSQETHELERKSGIRRPCLGCKKLRQRCDLLEPSCSRCLRRQQPCLYSSTAAIQSDNLAPSQTRCFSGGEPIKRIRSGSNHTTPCETCRSRRRKCDMLKPVCSRCTFKNVRCVYQEAEAIPRIDPTTILVRPSISVNTSHELEELDLMPSMQDLEVFTRFLEQANSMFILREFKGFVHSFFTEPPVLRLAFCAIAAHLQTPRLPEHICQMYYARGRRAAARSVNLPSMKVMQALLMLASFALSNHQHSVGRPLFESAIRMLIHLGMHIDPDDSPWLQSQNLNEADKEERRFLFWFAYYTFKWTQIAVFKPPIPISLESNRIKPAKQRTVITSSTAHPNAQVATLCQLSSILDIILEATNSCRGIPTDVTDILSSPTVATLGLHLTYLRTIQIPPHLFLNRNDDTLTNFLASIEDPINNPVPILDSVMVTMLYSAAVCILHRPVLYITAFLPLAKISADHLKVLLTVLKKCVSAARSITGLNSWLVHFLEKNNTPAASANSSPAPVDSPSPSSSSPPSSSTSSTSKFRRKFWKEDWYSSGVLFEAAVILWFVTCRTQRFYWRPTPPSPPMDDDAEGIQSDFLRMNMEDRKLIREEVMDILATLRDLEGVLAKKDTARGELNHITEMVACVVEMVDEMRLVEHEVSAGAGETCVPLDIAIREMRGVDISGTTQTQQQQQQQQPEETVRAFAWVFQGLLGVEVGVNGFRWRGETEDLWRKFWDKTACL